MKRLVNWLLFLAIISLTTPALAAPPASEHILYGYPSTTGTILVRKGYVLDHDNAKKVAIWVSYHLTDAYLVPKSPARTISAPTSISPPASGRSLRITKTAATTAGIRPMPMICGGTRRPSPNLFSFPI